MYNRDYFITAVGNNVMGFLGVWSLLLLAGAVCSANVQSRIEGGADTTIENYPSLVQVEFLVGIFWRQSCGGTILTSVRVLSAANCFSGFLFNTAFRRIRAGATERNTGGYVAGVAAVTNHPNFDQNNSGIIADISVIELSVPLIYSPTVQQGTIVAAGSRLPDNTPVVKAGWGVNAEGVSAEVLQEVRLLTVNNEECARKYAELETPGVVTDDMICAGLPAGGGRNSCAGDAGGPVYYDNIVIGVISWGHGCGNEDLPQVNTAVSPYTDWIVATAT